MISRKVASAFLEIFDEVSWLVARVQLSALLVDGHV